MPRYTRRRLIETGLGTAVAGSLAGCLGGGTDGATATAQSSFFVFGDFASAVAGDVTTTETLVPVGQHGHGWEPGPRVQGTVLESELFVYGTPGFQPWVDDLVTSLRDDGADVTIVAAADGIGGTHGDGHDGGHDHEGEDEGDSHDHEDEAETDGHDEDHGHADGLDPHFWLNPELAKHAVDTIRRGFVEVDDDNADAYADNAAAYRSRLDELDRAFRTTLESASTDVVLVAGHDAFTHLGRRYGFEVRTVTGLSPDDRPTARDIERAREIVAEHDLEVVCADPLESQQAADQLVEETDATEVLPLTPIPGRTRAWADQGMGYVEIMERINLETLRRALDAA